jgi:hypothetical protein
MKCNYGRQAGRRLILDGCDVDYWRKTLLSGL